MMAAVDLTDQQNPVTVDPNEWGLTHASGEAINNDWISKRIKDLNQRRTRLPWLVTGLASHDKVRTHEIEGIHTQ